MIQNSISLLLLCVVLLFNSCAKEEKLVVKKVPRQVKYGVVQMEHGDESRSFSGTTQSGTEANLSFRSNGLITMLKVKVGDRIKKGQLLATIDPKDVQFSLGQAQATLRNSKIQMETAKSSLDRVKQLYTTGNATLNDYEQAKSGYATAYANYQTAQKGVSLQRSQLQYTKIVAPSEGIISAVNMTVNEFAKAGSPVIVMNSGEEDIEIEVGLPEIFISRITHGDTVIVTIPSIDKASFKAIVTEVGYSTVTSVTYPVTLKLLNPTEAVRPGMPAEVTFSMGTQKGSGHLIVPIKAVGEDYEGNFVFKLEKRGDHFITKKHPIKIGTIKGGGFQVIDGVVEGDKVAIAGLRSLYDGREVTLLEQ